MKTKTPPAITLLEEWDSKEDHAKYIAWRTETGMMDVLASMVDAEPVTRFHDSLDI